MAIIEQPAAGFSDFLTPRRFSTADYLRMIETGVLETGVLETGVLETGVLETGVLGPADRVELIEGMIVEMSPAGIPHNRFLMKLVRLFAPLLDRYEFSVQGTMPFADGHVYDPDFMLLEQTPDTYKTKYPEPADVLLLIEASHSSFKKDQQVKLPVYADAGIRDYWIADLEREVILVHRQPQGNAYRKVTTRQGGDILSLLAVPEFSFAVHEVFG